MTGGEEQVGSEQWNRWRESVDLDEYAQRWRRMEAAGENPHGEADFVSRFAPGSVLDAGCGMGRVAIELARRGIETVGVDVDPDLLARARADAPELEWELADLTELRLDRPFDVVVAAGNVIGFVEESRRSEAVTRCAAHVAPGGRLIVGYQLRRGWPSVDEYERWCVDAGLEPEERWSTWAGDPFVTGSTYLVSVHRRR